MGGKTLIFSLAIIAGVVFLGLIIWSIWGSINGIKKAKEKEEIQRAKFMANIQQSEIINEKQVEPEKIEINYGVQKLDSSKNKVKKSLFDEDEVVHEEEIMVTGKLSDYLKK